MTEDRFQSLFLHASKDLGRAEDRTVSLTAREMAELAEEVVWLRARKDVSEGICRAVLEMAPTYGLPDTRNPDQQIAHERAAKEALARLTS